MRPNTAASGADNHVPVRLGWMLWEKLERAKGLEPSTPTLARSCSTTELHPHPVEIGGDRTRRQWRELCQMPAANATVRKPAKSAVCGQNRPAGTNRPGNQARWRNPAARSGGVA